MSTDPSSLTPYESGQFGQALLGMLVGGWSLVAEETAEYQLVAVSWLPRASIVLCRAFGPPVRRHGRQQPRFKRCWVVPNCPHTVSFREKSFSFLGQFTFQKTVRVRSTSVCSSPSVSGSTVLVHL